VNALLIGSVSSSLHALDALLGNDVVLTGVLGLDESARSGVADYHDLRDASERAGVPFQSFQKIDEPTVERFIRTHQPDLLWVIGLSQLVPGRLIRIARHGGVGFHPTMLPKGRGRAPVAWTILRQERAAVTLFFLNDEPDSGDIIAQREVPVLRDDYSEDLIARTNKTLREVIAELAPAIRSGNLPRTPQDHSLATVYARRSPADGLIDWKQSTEEIYRLIRAAGRPYAGAFMSVGNQKLTIWRARPAQSTEIPTQYGRNQAGSVLRIDPMRGMLVRTTDGALWLTETSVRASDDA